MKRILFLCLALWPLLSGAEVRYRIIQIESGPQAPATYGSSATGINNSGEVVGYFDSPDLMFYHVFHFTLTGGMVDLGPTNSDFADPGDINDLGQIAGYTIGGGAFCYTPGVGFEYLGLDDANAINNRGQIAGGTGGSAWRFTPGVGVEVFPETADGRGINDAGWVVGQAPPWNAFLYRDDQGVINLGPGAANAINNHGVVVGEWWGLPSVDYSAVVWANGQARLLGTFGGDISSASAINNRNQVVGLSQRSDGSQVGFIWTEEEGMLDLNSLVDTNSGWQWIGANDINENGWIAGDGWYQNKRQACLLIPILPKLEIARAGTNVVISWSPHWPRLVLETAPYHAPTNWLPVPGGTNDPVVLPATGPGQVFRLTQYDTLDPKLSVRATGSNLVASWTPPWPDYALESTPSLTAPTWLPVSGATNSPVHLPRVGTSDFFRLRR
ncbi:MAG: hypothetical protein HZA90_08385 [Verrucomicrobia bacterium]|nr:hypothetical protein [Verrucomicrobiota bacterium]